MAERPDMTELLEASLRATALRRNVIARNIANVRTPGFRRSAVQFEQRLAEAMKSARGIETDDLKAVTHQPKDTPVSADGNDVSLDVEVGEMIKNDVRHKIYLRLLSGRYRKMEMAIRGQL